MILHGLIKGAADHFRLNRTVHVRHFLGALTDQHDHQVNVFVVGRDAIGDAFEDRCLAGLGRAHDETALPTADGREQVNHACGDNIGPRLQQ